MRYSMGRFGLLGWAGVGSALEALVGRCKLRDLTRGLEMFGNVAGHMQSGRGDILGRLRKSEVLCQNLQVR
jgi:hypothetical protein